MSARIGSSLHAVGGQIIHVSKILQHEEYDNISCHNDISILEFEEAIEFKDKAQPVPLAETEPKEGTWCDVSGWGIEWEGGVISDRLQHALIPVIPRDICAVKYTEYTITDHVVCAGFHDGFRDTCKGDSGGPLVSNGIQVGVATWGVGCGRENRPGVYTNVAALRSWIKKVSAI